MTGGPAGAGNTLVAGAFRGTWRDLPPLDLPPAAAVFCAGHLDALRAAWAHATSPRETLVAAVELARHRAGVVPDDAADCGRLLHQCRRAAGVRARSPAAR